MQIVLTCLLFVVGIICVVKGGDIFVDAASWIAKAMNVPSFIIGATIVSLATTMPEMLVSFMAAAEGKTDMAIGNAVGSVTANTALIMGTAMVAMQITCRREKYMKPILLLIAAAAVLLFSCLSGELNPIGGVILAILCVLFMAQNIVSARQESQAVTEKEPVDRRLLIKNILFFLLGACAIVIGSRLMVNTGSDIAAWLGVPERIIALTLLAVGTSLPELVTTITAIVKKESALSVGNIIGANIIDLSLILPISSLISGKNLPVSESSIRIDLPACLLVTLVALVPMLFRQKASKWQGILLLLLYVGYLILVL
jgi:cation:H+ antiporter